MAATNTPDRGPEIVAVDIVFCALAVLVVLLRCFTRARLVKAFGLDDWLMIVAAVSIETNFAPRTQAPNSSTVFSNLGYRGFSSCLLSCQTSV